MTFSNAISKTWIFFLVPIILSSCAIQPVAWTPPAQPEFKDQLALNDKLAQAECIPLLGYYGAEEFAIDEQGNLYCGVHKGEKDFSSGAILKIAPDDSVETWLHTEKWITGLQFTPQGKLLAMMNGVGLIQINEDKSIDTLVKQSPEGLPILMGTGMKIAADGKVYFVNMSSTQETSFKYVNKLILEMKPTGGVPAFIQPKAEKFGMVLEVSESAEIIQALFDPKGSKVTEAGAVKEWKGHLYLGGDVVAYVSKVKLF